MAISFGKVSLRVFAIVKGAGRKVKMFDEIGNKVFDPERCRRFYVQPEHMMVTIREAGDDSEIKVYLHEGIDIQSIQRFLNSLRKTAVHYNLKFTVRKFGRQITPKDFAFQAEIEKGHMDETKNGGRGMDELMEKMSGYKNVSYQKIGDCKLVVRHSSPIDENKIGARGRNIKAVYVENGLGERFIMPYPHLNGGRAMARHLSEGGILDDDIGVRIKDLINEWNNLRGVSRYISDNIKVIGDNDSSKNLRDLIKNRIIDINITFKTASGSRGYNDSKAVLIENDDVDHALVEAEHNWIVETLRLEEGNDSFMEGTKALARFSAKRKMAEGLPMDMEPVINEPTVRDVMNDPEEFQEFNEWIGQFSPDRILAEEQVEEDIDEFMSQGTKVNLVPTPLVNRVTFPEANWLKKSMTATLCQDVVPGTMDVIKVELENGTTKPVYGFNIEVVEKNNEDVEDVDLVWETASRLVHWRKNSAILTEIADTMSDHDLDAALTRISEVWMPSVADEIRNMVLPRAATRSSLDEAWEEMFEEDNRPTKIEFRHPADMIVSTRHLQKAKVQFETDYDGLSLAFEDADVCYGAARILKEQNIQFNEDIMGGDMGDDFKRDISPDYRRQEDENTPKYTGFPYEVPDHDVNNLISILDDENIDFTVVGNVFYFGSQADHDTAVDLHHPNDIDRGIIGEMQNLRNRVVRLSDYRK